MSAYDRTKLADALRTEEFQDGEHIVKQGEPGDVFYLIEEGSAVAMKVFPGKTEAEEVETYKVRRSHTNPSGVYSADRYICM